MKEPSLKKVMSLQIEVDEPIVAGQTGLGKRQLIPIRGGTVSGAVKGRVLPGGADAQIIRPNGRVDLSARYALETEEHEVIYVENNGIRQVSEPFRQQAAEGRIIDPEHVYFRTVPVFETSSEAYQFLQDQLFIGAAVRLPDDIRLDIYEVQ
ncbi:MULTISPECIES: DUF3237 domain-containing protein [Bacillus amyloliquefaciens group]|uniref:DUF3237 domain-containing protein n=1 Tax=Bacillus amyloliquefaciens group TaxID=1938374 RepID=UPI0022707479|nr:DUF3237 domain-containing protein [Bacillus velezensis]MCY0091054.1 DUF3237 domain-containing protein [Bacillus velezensis]